jgi:SAM-dependent methyltransferase
MKNNSTNAWWSEQYGFFGELYMKGDNSKEGYLTNNKQNLKERTETEVKGIIDLLSLKAGEKILDIPSGYGRHSILLAQLGFDATGSELNSIHLKKASENAIRKNVNVNFVQENMLDLTYKNEFNVLVNMFYSFGFFEVDEENVKVLENFHRALRPGGKFLMHTDVNMACVRSGKYKLNETRPLQNGDILKIDEWYDNEKKRMEGSWDDGNKKKGYSVRVYEVEEFVTLCKKVGFKDVKVYSDWNGSEYSETSEMIIFVAEK